MTRKPNRKFNGSTREHFKVIERRSARLEYLQKKIMGNSPGTFVASFYFTPEELGITPGPTEDQIQKLGLERATQRVDRRDFFTQVAVRVKGEANKEHLATVREDVRLDTINKIRGKETGLDLSQFTTMNPEEVTDFVGYNQDPEVDMNLPEVD